MMQCFIKKQAKRTVAAVLVCLGLLFLLIFVLPAPKKRIFFEGHGGIVYPYARVLIDKINKTGLKTDTPYKFYVANFEKGMSVLKLKKYDERAVLWLGSSNSPSIEGLENFGTILVSTPALKMFLKMHKIKSFYLPLPALEKQVQRAAFEERFVAIIGQPPFIEDILKEKGLAYRLYKATDTENIRKDMRFFSAVFAKDTAFTTETLDPHPVYFEIAAAGIPIALPWEWPETEETINLFNDRINFYMSKKDAGQLVDDITSRSPSADILRRAKQAGGLVYDRFSLPKTAARLKYILENKKEPAPFYVPDSVGIDISVSVGHIGSGDFWLAQDLNSAFEARGKKAEITFFNSLYKYPTEANILMRGPLPPSDSDLNGRINILYIAYAQFPQSNTEEFVDMPKDYIPHLSAAASMKKMDALAVASEDFADELNRRGLKTYYVPQFTNTDKFYPDYDENLKSEILFVGNNAFYRQAPQIAVKHGLPITIYGANWNGAAKETYIDNRILRRYYSSAKINLNDTREGMRKYGFIANRVFDVTASGGFLISDYSKAVEKVYGDTIPMWKTEDELVALIKYYLDPAHEAERLDKARRAREITLKNFTADQAAARFEAIIHAVTNDKKR